MVEEEEERRRGEVSCDCLVYLHSMTLGCMRYSGLEEMLDDLVLGEEEEVNVGEEAFDEEAEPTEGGPGAQKSGKKAAAARATPY